MNQSQPFSVHPLYSRLLKDGHGGWACQIHGLPYGGVVKPADGLFNPEGDAVPEWVRPGLCV
ncbi:MAG: hypothetical protein GY696_25755 [Gammaproteobacteria bacterium]|nr:hypothetical protein [Gammaproteobacteria bacterium]